MNIETFKALDPEAKNEADVNSFVEFMEELLVMENKEQAATLVKEIFGSDKVKLAKYRNATDISHKTFNKLALHLLDAISEIGDEEYIKKNGTLAERVEKASAMTRNHSLHSAANKNYVC